MQPSINYSEEDPKLCLLKEILNIIDDKKTYRIIGRLGVHNINKFQNMIKIVLGSMFYEYTISKLINELNRQDDLQTLFNIDELPTEKQVYEYMSKVSPETINKMVNSILKPYHNKNTSVVIRYTVDATPVKSILIT